MSKKIVITDTLSDEYYCVKKTQIDPISGELIVGENDFPYWSTDINEAHDFRIEKLGFQEIDILDLTEDGKRNPIIISHHFINEDFPA